MYPTSTITFTNNQLIKDGITLASPLNTEDWYQQVNCNYPKFFKMDTLSKWAFLATEMLLKNENNGWHYDGFDKNKIAIILATKNGCIDIDKKFSTSLETIASPALFVYTLPNIMLGEICIRHGFKGEQLCLIEENYDPKDLSFYVNELWKKEHTEACLWGWIDCYETQQEFYFNWTKKI